MSFNIGTLILAVMVTAGIVGVKLLVELIWEKTLLRMEDKLLEKVLDKFLEVRQSTAEGDKVLPDKVLESFLDGNVLQPVIKKKVLMAMNLYAEEKFAEFTNTFGGEKNV